MKTTQEFFDITVQHLYGMERRAGREIFVGDFRCLYKDQDGNRCAVGAHLPDTAEYVYHNGNVIDLLRHQPEVAQYLRPTDADSLRHVKVAMVIHDDHDSIFDEDEEVWVHFWMLLQAVHDDAKNWGTHGFNQRGFHHLYDAAEVFGLQTPQPPHFLPEVMD